MNTQTKKKLAIYSASAAAFLLHTHTQAQIVYSDIDPDLHYSDGDPSDYFFQSLDIDTDGTVDVLFAFSQYQFSGSCYIAGSMFMSLVNYASVLLTDDSTQVKMLNKDDTISNKGNWDNYSLPLMFSTSFSYDYCDADEEYVNIHGSWINADDKYVGLRINHEGIFYYGWIRLNILITDTISGAHVNNITIKDYAYELMGDSAIYAGDTITIQIDTTTEDTIVLGIGNFDLLKWSIYPNPASEILTILLPNHDITDADISIVNMNGIVVNHAWIADNKNMITLYIKDLPEGIYTIHIRSNNFNASDCFIKQ